MAAPVFWLVIAALSMLNFGADLIVAGAAHLSGWDVMVMTGSWLILGGVAVLVWAATTRRRLSAVTAQSRKKPVQPVPLSPRDHLGNPYRLPAVRTRLAAVLA